MPKKRSKIKRKKEIHKSNRLFLFLFLAFLLIVAVSFRKTIQNEIKAIIETPRSETKKIPPEVSRNLDPRYSPKYKVPILLYHYVEYVTDEKDTIRKSLNIEPDIFEAQVKTLKENGHTFMTASELAQVLNGNSRLPRKPVLLTFDDGHWDVETVILPILKKYNARATAYVAPALLNGSDFMTKKQMEKIIDSGLIEIGAHTVHHISLQGKISPIVMYEVTQSKKILENEYGIRVLSFAYPNGDFDQQAIDIIKDAGYLTAVTTVPGILQSKQNQYFLLRLRPGQRIGKDLTDYFNQTEFKPY